MSKKSLFLIVGTVVLVVALIGIRAIQVYIHEQSEAHQRAEQMAKAQDAMKQWQQQLGAYQQTQQNMPNFSGMSGATANPAAMILMMRFKLDQETTEYFSKVQTDVISQTKNSIRYTQAFPEGPKADTTVTFTPDQRYVPTPAEIARATRTGSYVYNVKLTAQQETPTRLRIKLSYFVPANAIPTAIHQNFQASASPLDFLNPVPSVWADEGNASMGMSIASDTSMETYKEIAKQAIERMAKIDKLEHLEKAPSWVYGALYVLTGIKKYMEHEEWMDQLKEMKECAESNPLTNKAMENSDATSSLDDASSEVTQVSAVRGLNLATAFASMFVPGVFGTVMTPVATWNDESLKELAEQDMQDARKSLPACDKRPGRQASFKYVYKLDADGPCGKRKNINGSVEGSIQFDQDPMVHTVYGGEGDGTAEVTENYGGCNVQQHEHKNGAVHITLSGHGSARDAVLKVSFIGDNLTWMYTCAGGCNNNYHESGPRGYGDGCEINNVDLVRGGTFSGPGTQPNYATCTVTIPGQ